jgi:hypothetical protein
MVGLSREFDALINGARLVARASGQGANFPSQVTETERWEWPRIASEEHGQWYPALDPGWSLFINTPPVPLVDGAPALDPQRVVVCATGGQLIELFPGGDPGAEVLASARRHGISRPIFTRSFEIGKFWESLFGSRWYLDDMGRTLPALLLTTGRMRNHPQEGGETIEVEPHLLAAAERFGIRFEKIIV